MTDPKRNEPDPRRGPDQDSEAGDEPAEQAATARESRAEAEGHPDAEWDIPGGLSSGGRDAPGEGDAPDAVGPDDAGPGPAAEQPETAPDAAESPSHAQEVTASVAELDPSAAASLLVGESAEDIEKVLGDLPAETALKIAAQLPAEAAARESAAPAPSQESLSGVEGTVAQLMVEAFGVLRPQATVAKALDYVVDNHPQLTVTYIFVADEAEKLVGVVAMRDLLLASPGQKLQEIMSPEPFSFAAQTSIPEAISAALAKRFRLYPVTDDDGVLLGLVYGWRLFEYAASEISAQPGAMVGLGPEERVSTPILQAFRMRHPWLQVNLLTAFAAAFVVSMFEDTIARIVALAVFLPVLAGQSGNTGCQALAITLRSLTLGELEGVPVLRLLRKEIVLGALNGFFVGLIAAAAMGLYVSMGGGEDALTLALVVLVAMVGACIGSGVFGVMVPLTLRRFGADPAMASSIFLTTFTDILGMGLMLLLATTLLM